MKNTWEKENKARKGCVTRGWIRELTKIQGTLSAGHVIVDVRYAEGVDCRLAHPHA